MGNYASVKPFSTVASLLLVLVALGHLIRFVMHWTVLVNGVIVPIGVSGPVFGITGAAALGVWRKGIIPLWMFNFYWIGWSALSVVAVIWNLRQVFPFLITAFLFAETLGILFTVKDAGTLTDTTAKYVPEDATFIILGLIFWRVAKWVAEWHLLGYDWTFAVWILVSWLIQHFIVHYLPRGIRERTPTGWLAPRKIKHWWRVSVRPTNELQEEERVSPTQRDIKDDEIKRKIFASVILFLLSLGHLFRLLVRWQLTVNGLNIPAFLSVFICIIAAGVAVMLEQEARDLKTMTSGKAEKLIEFELGHTHKRLGGNINGREPSAKSSNGVGADPST